MHADRQVLQIKSGVLNGQLVCSVTTCSRRIAGICDFAGYPAAGAPGTVSRSRDAVPAWIVAAWRLLAFTWTNTADEILNSLAAGASDASAVEDEEAVRTAVERWQER